MASLFQMFLLTFQVPFRDQGKESLGKHAREGAFLTFTMHDSHHACDAAVIPPGL